jgi:hypothetical protein
MWRLIIFLTAFFFISCQLRDPISTEDKPAEPAHTTLSLVRDSSFTTLPCYIHFMFQVIDYDKRGYSQLKRSDFLLKEDDQPVSVTESEDTLINRHAVHYTLKTVIMLDNSASVNANLSSIKTAAKTLLRSMDPSQQIALYSFSDHPIVLQDFTTDSIKLRQAVDKLTEGPQTTDLNGAVITGTSRWQDYYTVNDICQGFLILVTDGRDTQGRWNLAQALAARGSKRIFAIGLGNEIDPVALGKIANQGFTFLDKYTTLPARFKEIQQEMVDWANSFYWLRYQSPKRSDKMHTLKMILITPGPKLPVDSLSVSYSSATFYSKP